MPDTKNVKTTNDPYDDPEYIAYLEQMLSDMKYSDDFINDEALMAGCIH